MSEQAVATTCARTPGACGREAPAAHGWREGDPVRSHPSPRQAMSNQAVSPWCTKTDDEPTSFTPVRNGVDLLILSHPPQLYLLIDKNRLFHLLRCALFPI
jgi:hypothetical protein